MGSIPGSWILFWARFILRWRSSCVQELHQSAFPIFVFGCWTTNCLLYREGHCGYYCGWHDVQSRRPRRSDADHDANEEPTFGSAAEINALLLQRHQAAAKAKKQALSLFKRIESEDDAAIYSYLVMIPKTKTTLFRLVVRYMFCKTSFRMAFELIGCMYDVLGNLGLLACSRDEINNFVRIVYVVNL